MSAFCVFPTISHPYAAIVLPTMQAYAQSLAQYSGSQFSSFAREVRLLPYPHFLQYPLVEALRRVSCDSRIFFQSRHQPHDIGRSPWFYLLTISIIDYRHRIIPDELSLSLAAIGLGVWANSLPLGVFGIGFWKAWPAGVGGGLLMFVVAWAGKRLLRRGSGWGRH